MKKIIFITGVLLLGFFGIATAQYCPSPVRGQNAGFNSARSYSNASFAANNLNRIAYDFAYALNRGYRDGELTRHEIFVLENDLNRLTRKMDRALYDGRLTSSEWAFIQFDIRNLERDIQREWSDNQRRDS